MNIENMPLKERQRRAGLEMAELFSQAAPSILAIYEVERRWNVTQIIWPENMGSEMKESRRVSGSGLHSISFAWAVFLCNAGRVIRPKKKRPSDVNQKAHSILQDVITLSEKPVKFPKVESGKKAKRK